MIAHGIDLNSIAIRDFCRKWNIRELSVFGSILRDDFQPDSDVDFLVEHDDDAQWDLFDSMHMEEELATLVGRPVDIVDRYAVENGGNKFVKQQILSTAKPTNAKIISPDVETE